MRVLVANAGELPQPALWLTFRPQDVVNGTAILNRCRVSYYDEHVLELYRTLFMSRGTLGGHADLLWSSDAAFPPRVGVVSGTDAPLPGVSMCFNAVIAVPGMANFDWDAGYYLSILYRPHPVSGYRPQYLFGQGPAPEGPVTIQIKANERWAGSATEGSDLAPRDAALHIQLVGDTVGVSRDVSMQAAFDVREYPNFTASQVSHSKTELVVTTNNGISGHSKDIHRACCSLSMGSLAHLLVTFDFVPPATIDM